MDNLVVTCQWCNDARGTKNYGKFKVTVAQMLRKGCNIGPVSFVKHKEDKKRKKEDRRMLAAWETRARQGLLALPKEANPKAFIH